MKKVLFALLMIAGIVLYTNVGIVDKKINKALKEAKKIDQLISSKSFKGNALGIVRAHSPSFYHQLHLIVNLSKKLRRTANCRFFYAHR